MAAVTRRSMSARNDALTRAKAIATFPPGQFINQHQDDPRGRVVQVGDRVGFDDQPTDRAGSAVHEGAHLIGKAACVCIEEIGAEAIENKTRLGLTPRRCRRSDPTMRRSTAVLGR
jgi:hypothetical protein